MSGKRLYTAEELRIHAEKMSRHLQVENILFTMNASFMLCRDLIPFLSHKTNLFFWKPKSCSKPPIIKGHVALVDTLYDTGATRQILFKAYPLESDYFCLVSKRFDIFFTFDPLPAPDAFLYGYGLDDRNDKRTAIRDLLYETY